MVNIGGIANITWLGPMLLGYDTGPGNLLMDAWTERHLGQAFDTDGQWAQSGQAHKLLLKAMLGDPFLRMRHPAAPAVSFSMPHGLIVFMSVGICRNCCTGCAGDTTCLDGR